MPRVLNVERLVNKFASLTRARESVTSMSLWIMHHSEFHEEIVEEWLSALSKNFNALALCYVANDVIINCGKKRVPQFRPAFSKVLEKAMCLENVKEISKEVYRMLQLWQEREIYSDEFCEALRSKLNSPPVEDTAHKEDQLETTDLKDEEEAEESELDIISKFKKENLFDKLIKLKNLNEEVAEKEQIIKFADEPQKPDFQTAEKIECQTLLSEVETYCGTLKGFIKLAENEVAARNKVLKELKNTNVFYTSQNEDVKKVAHAYKIYGRKIKNVSKALSEKKETLEDIKEYSSDNDISSPKSPDENSSAEDSSNFDDSMPTTPHSPSYLHSNNKTSSPVASFSHVLSSTLSEKLKCHEEQQITTEKDDKSSNLAISTEELQKILQKSATVLASPAHQSPKIVDSLNSNSNDSTSMKNGNTLKKKGITDIHSPKKADIFISASKNNSTVSINKPLEEISLTSGALSDCKSLNKNTLGKVTECDDSVIISDSLVTSIVKHKVIPVLYDGMNEADIKSTKAEFVSSMPTEKYICATETPEKDKQMNDQILKRESFKQKIELLLTEKNRSANENPEKDENSLKRELIKQKMKLLLPEKNISASESPKINEKTLKRESVKRQIELLSKEKSKPDTQNPEKDGKILKREIVEQKTELLSTEKNTPATENAEKDAKTLKRESIKRKIELLLKTKGKKLCPTFDQKHDSELKDQTTALNKNETLSSATIIKSDQKESSLINLKGTADDKETSNKLNNFTKNISVEPAKIESECLLNVSKEIGFQNCTNNDSETVKSKFDIIITDNLNEDNSNTDSTENSFFTTTDISLELKNSDLPNQNQISLQKTDDFNTYSEPQDTFFSSLCSSARFEKVQGIPGLEISEPPKTVPENSTATESDNGICEMEVVTTEDLQLSKPTIDKNDLAKDSEDQNCEVTNEDTSSILSSCVSNSDTNPNTFDCSGNVNCKDLKSESVKESNEPSIKNESKPGNILNALQRVLQGLSEFKTLNLCQKPAGNTPKEHPNLSPFIPLESCLSIYGALQYKSSYSENVNTCKVGENKISDDSLIKTNLSGKPFDFKIQTNCNTTSVLHGSIVSTFDSSSVLCTTSNQIKQSFPLAANFEEDNREVADMECDSD